MLTPASHPSVSQGKPQRGRAASRAAQSAAAAWERGVAHARHGRHQQALDEFKAAVRATPGDGLYWLNLANSERKCGRHADALASARKAFDLEPRSLDACHLLASLQRRDGATREALATLDKLPVPVERDGAWHFLKGALLYDLNRIPDAMQSLLGALALSGDAPQVRVKSLMQLGHCMALVRRHFEAGQCYRTVLDLEPDSLAAALYAAHYSAWSCDWAELDRDIERLGRCMSLVRDSQEHAGKTYSLSPFCLLTLTDDPALMRWAAESACIHAPRQAPSPQVVTPSNLIPRPAGKLRIGLLSSDFHHHATTMLVVETLEHIDRSRYELWLYSGGANDGSALRHRIEAAATCLREVAELDQAELAQQIRTDQIGVLMDLKGFTQGSRMSVLAQRPAPIQVAWLGYPGTSGADFVDYIIGDPVVTPLEHQPHFTEQIAQLPHCYQPNDSQRSHPATLDRTACGLPPEAFVFASFNQAYKIVPEVFAAWCTIVASRPDAVLWLLVPEPQTQAHLRAAAAAHGLPPDRLFFADFAPIERHRARLPNVDLALDTFPCGGHTTASDALWAGVPVLALQGQAFASRVAASLLHTLGVPELVCTQLDDYVERAIALAGSPADLAQLRRRVELGRNNSPLFRGREFAGDLQHLIDRMVQRHEAGLAPAALAADAAGDTVQPPSVD
ncbi:MAG: hypothetical protein RL375_985 [Pseudomonadota bacterium]|jgi:predicted O-linked N-acetylglucosamine transferase (SPINDLY family)